MGKASTSPVISTRRVGSIGQPQLNVLKPNPRSGKEKTELHQAVISRNYNRLSELLRPQSPPPRRSSTLTISGREVSLDINDQDEFGRTALHWAIALKDLKSFEILLAESRTNRYRTDKDGRTPLHDAAIRGWEEGTRTLLQKNEINDTTPNDRGMSIVDNGGRTALHWSAEYGHSTITEMLAKPAVIKAVDKDQNTAMHRAAQRGHANAVAILIKVLADNHADLEPKNKDQKTPFKLAAENGHEEVAWLFIKKPELQPQHRSMALFWIRECQILHKNKLLLWATKNRHEAILQLLLEKGADVMTEDGYKRTPLSYAAQSGHKDIVQLLLDYGANVMTESQYKRTPLLYAAKYGHKDIVQLLLDKGANIMAEDNDYRMPLSYAAKNGHKDIVQQLLDKGANFMTSDVSCKTPLLYAAEIGHKDIMQLLLDKGANVMTKDFSRQTPLLYAAKNGRKDIVQLLLDKGADVMTEDYLGRTPLLYAAKNGHKDIAQLLRLHGAKA